MENVLDRIKYIAKNEGITITGIEANIGASKGVLSRAIANKTDIQLKWVQKIVENYPLYSTQWLLTGEPPMLKSEVKIVEQNTGNKKLIPFYDDVASIGGTNTISASVEGCMPVSEWIDAGDWFPEATAAIRHYGDSMLEYPSGCILALKQVEDKRLIIWGRNYSIETTEFRLTKRLQKGMEDDCLMAYSSNIETYPDGHLIHEPVTIPKETIRNIFLIIGCVIKEQSSGAVYIKQ